MTFGKRSASLFTLILLGSSPTIATASPTMVRLGYATCSACHLAPQGAGLLTDYGKGIDEAQSLRSGEYLPSDPAQSRLLRYDARWLTSGDLTGAPPSGGTSTPPSWLRSYFRSSAAFGARQRLASTVFLEAPAGNVARLWNSKPAVDILGAWEYRQSDRFTLAVARDRLPRGVELGETRTILQDGATDRFPTQLRAFFSTDRVRVTTYAYAPGSSNAWNRRAYGAGVLGELQFLSNHLVLGVSARRAFEEILHEQSMGAHVRLGFGKWGVLAEHELTDRTNSAGPQVVADRYAGYTQVFFAPKEWLVTSLIGEQSHDLSPSGARTFRWRPEVQARLSSYVTVTASARTDTTPGTTGTSRAYLVQVALKTVQ